MDTNSEHQKESDVQRQSYIEAIMQLLEKADIRKIDLVWTYAKHLIQ
jgi:hypothetical protein